MLRNGLLAALMLGFLMPAAAPKLSIDSNHSTVGFAVPIAGGLSKVRGKFTDYSVTVVHDELDISRASFTATIKAASINTGIPERDAHLRGADFFDVEKFPEITFQSERIEKKEQQLTAYGTFTMHGVSKQIALPFTITGRHVTKTDVSNTMNVGYSLRSKLNRRDYGINWRHDASPDFVGDEIEIEIDLISKSSPAPK